MAAMFRPVTLLCTLPGVWSLALEPHAHCELNSMDFTEFVEKYGRMYEVGSEEYAARQAIFEERAARIASHNCDPAAIHSATINHLTDWTPAELKTLFGHRSMRTGQQAGQHLSLLEVSTDNHMKPKHKRHKKHKKNPQQFPKYFSWGNLSSIQANSTDQSTCGSCWAHAARLTMQARAEIKGKTNLHWSTNQLIACTPNAKHCGGEGGCDGATAELAYEYVLNNGLLQADEFTKKVGSADQKTVKCPKALQASTEVATRALSGNDGSEVHRVGDDTKGLHGLWVGLTGWTKLAENKEEPLLHELMHGGPLYVAVAAGDHWFDYKSGVMTEDGCDRDFIVNHAVVLFAWGVKEKTIRGPVKYWQIKNSWGPNWGESGTGRVIRSDQEEKVCGWDEDPQSGSGCDGGPERVWVCGTCGILYDAVAPHF